MEISIFLAKILGLFGCISTLAIVSRYKKHLEIESEYANSLGSIVISGFLFLLIGVTIVVIHPFWIIDWRLIITILGWMVLLKGALRIFFPEAVQKMIEKKKGNFQFVFGELIVFLISLYLLYKGYFSY